MNKRSRRKVLVLAIVFGVATATVLGLTAFEENLLYFYSPTQVKSGDAPQSHTFRVGGLVVDGSVRRAPDSLTVAFDVTDNEVAKRASSGIIALQVHAGPNMEVFYKDIMISLKP